MHATVILCNHVETQNNLLYMNGAGIDRSLVPEGTPSPYVVSLGLAVMIRVPWTATNEPHKAVVQLLDADGHHVSVPNAAEGTHLRVELDFNVGRPAGLVAGDEQGVNFAVNFPGIPLPALGSYRFVVEVDGTPLADAPYRLVSAHQTHGFGPTSLPS